MSLFALKIVVAVVGLMVVVVFMLGPTLGLDINFESLLQFFADAITGFISFLSKLVEGLLS